MKIIKEISKKDNLIYTLLYISLFLFGIKALFHGFPDIERFFPEWSDERLSLTYIMKFGTLNFAPTQVWHPPLYHYLTFIPIALFYFIGKLIGVFHDKIEFVRFYFFNTQYFFLIARAMSYIFYWLTAVMIFKISRLSYDRKVSHIATLAYLLVPKFITDFATTRPETLLHLNSAIFFYFFLRFYLDNKKIIFLYLTAFFLGISIATKYNALFLGSIFIPLFFYLKRIPVFTGMYKRIITLYLKIGILVFLGFFICDPFFVIKLKTYLYNFIVYNKEVKYYWNGINPAAFIVTHAGELSSFLYFNFFGVTILLAGIYHLFKNNKWLFLFMSFVVLIFETYFGIFQSGVAPLRYLNPIIPLAVLFFGAGINFILTQRRKLIFVIPIFFIIQSYNYTDLLRGFSLSPTYTQEVRYFIERNIPEYTKICITFNSHMPQLNMTRESYWHLIKTAPVFDTKGQEIVYRKMEDESLYGSILREIRIESMEQKPQYNIIRWDTNIKTENDAVKFLKENKIEYIIGFIFFKIGNKNPQEISGISLVKEFKPKNPVIYGKDSLLLYHVDFKD